MVSPLRATVCTHLCYVDMCGGAMLALHVLITVASGMFCPPSPRLNCLCAPRSIHVAESPTGCRVRCGRWDRGTWIGVRAALPRSGTEVLLNMLCYVTFGCVYTLIDLVLSSSIDDIFVGAAPDIVNVFTQSIVLTSSLFAYQSP